MIPALINAGATLLGNAITNRKESNRYTQQLEDSKALWYMSNAYNSPTAQMARLKSAGLNPNLIYMNGGATPTSDTPSTPAFQSSPISEYNAFGDTINSTRQIESDVRLKDSQTAENLANYNVLSTPLGQMQEFGLMSEEAKKSMANLFGVPEDKLSGLNFRFMQFKNEYEQLAKNNGQLQKLLDILDHEKNTAASQALSAQFQSMIDFMLMNSEARVRGFRIEQAASFPIQSIRGIERDPKAVDYVANTAIQNYYQLLNDVSSAQWENTGFRRGVRSFGDILGGIGNVLPGIGSLLSKPKASNFYRSTSDYKSNHKK